MRPRSSACSRRMTLVLSGDSLTIEDVVRVARDGEHGAS